jgi:hypothetical protein
MLANFNTIAKFDNWKERAIIELPLKLFFKRPMMIMGFKWKLSK